MLLSYIGDIQNVLVLVTKPGRVKADHHSAQFLDRNVGSLVDKYAE